MFCIHCGARLRDNARFCYKCGTPVYRPEEAEDIDEDILDDVFTDAVIDTDTASVPEPAPAEEPEAHEEEAFAPYFPVTPEETAAEEAPDTGTEFEADTDLPEKSAETLTEEPYTETEPEETPAVPAEPEVPAEEHAVEAEEPREEPVPEEAPEVAPEVPAEPEAASPEEPADNGGPAPSEPASAEAEEEPARETEEKVSSSPENSGTGENSTRVNEPISVDPPVRRTKGAKDGKGIPSGLIAAVLAFIVIGAGALYTLKIYPQQKFNKYFDAGTAALEQLDYEEAAALFEKAYEINRNDPLLNVKLYSTYQGICDGFREDGNMEKAIEYAEKMIGLTETNDEEVKAILSELYLPYVRSLLMDGRKEKAATVINRAAEYVDSDTLTSLKDIQENFAVLQDLAEQYASLADRDDHRGVCELVADSRAAVIACSDPDSNRQPVMIVNGFEHKYVVFYRHSSGQYYVYYGDLSDEGERTGTGTIYYDGRKTSKASLYYYTSEWSGDKPNGAFDEHEFTGTNYATETIYEGSLFNGFFNGRIKITWGDEGVYYGEYDTGKVTVYGIDPETGGYIVAYNEAKDDWLSYSKNPSSSYFGVDFY